MSQNCVHSHVFAVHLSRLRLSCGRGMVLDIMNSTLAAGTPSFPNGNGIPVEVAASFVERSPVGKLIEIDRTDAKMTCSKPDEIPVDGSHAAASNACVIATDCALCHPITTTRFAHICLLPASRAVSRARLVSGLPTR